MAEGGKGNDMTLAVLALTVLISILGGLVFFLLRTPGSGCEDEGIRTSARRRGGVAEDDDDDGGDDEDDGRPGKKNSKNNAKKQEKRAQVQAERQMRQQREAKKSEKQQAYNEKQQARDAQKQKEDEAQEKARAAKAKKEQEELDKWRQKYGGESEGEDDAGDVDDETTDRMVEFLKVRKVTNLEDFAAEFRCRTCVAVDRLKELEKLGRISGFVNDRGEYMYLSSQEMSAVADWAARAGRISRADLVSGCDRLVRVVPTSEDKALLEQDMRSAVAALRGEGSAAAAA